MGTYLGGQLLVIQAHPGSSETPQLRTYYRNFALFLGLDIVALVVTFWLKSGNNALVEAKLTEEKASINCDTDAESSVYGEEDSILDHNNNSVRNYNYETISAKQTLPIKKARSQTAQSSTSSIPVETETKAQKNFLLVLFNWSNVRQTLSCFTKPRAQHVRLQIYLLFVILLGFAMVFFGGQTIMFQFSEKVYQWDSKTYTTFSSISNIAQTLFMTLCTVLLVKKWKFDDSTLLLIALISYFLNQMVIGTFLSPVAYIVGQIIGRFLVNELIIP